MSFRELKNQTIGSLKITASVVVVLLGLLWGLVGASDDFKSLFHAHSLFIYIVLAIFCLVVFGLSYLKILPYSADKDTVTKNNISTHIAEADVYDLRIRFGILKDARRIHEIAKSYFAEDLLLSMPELRAWLACDANIFRVAELISGEGKPSEIVGYYGLLPLQHSSFNLLKEQKISEISLEPIHFMKPGSGIEALYILDVARDQRFQIGGPLLRDLFRQIGDLMEKNTTLGEIGTWAFTEDGRKIARKLNMKKLKNFANFPNTAFYVASRASIEQQRFNSSGMFGKILVERFERDHTVKW